MNKNSIKAWNEIKYTTLADRERAVLKAITMYGPLNGADVDLLVNGGHRRIKNLFDSGVIEVAFNAIDKRTNKTTAYYMATGKEPIEHKVIRKSAPIDLSGFYDKAFEAGVTEAIKYIIPFGTTEEIAERVNEICEAMR